jgi:hypothetical protein
VNTELEALNALVGQWTTEATHPSFQGTVVQGRVEVEWLEGEQFLIHRAWSDHPDFPDSISVIGVTEELSMHYFDSRGVHRVYRVGASEAEWRIWRDAPGFSQRFTGRFSDGGDTLSGVWELSQDDSTWADDLEITYRRAG